jgi:hypothetical protein
MFGHSYNLTSFRCPVLFGNVHEKIKTELAVSGVTYAVLNYISSEFYVFIYIFHCKHNSQLRSSQTE